jgi:hypothetical protein
MQVEIAHQVFLHPGAIIVVKPDLMRVMLTLVPVMLVIRPVLIPIPYATTAERRRVIVLTAQLRSQAGFKPGRTKIINSFSIV